MEELLKELIEEIRIMNLINIIQNPNVCPKFTRESMGQAQEYLNEYATNYLQEKTNTKKLVREKK